MTTNPDTIKAAIAAADKSNPDWADDILELIPDAFSRGAASARVSDLGDRLSSDDREYAFEVEDIVCGVMGHRTGHAPLCRYTAAYVLEKLIHKIRPLGYHGQITISDFASSLIAEIADAPGAERLGEIKFDERHNTFDP